MWGSGGGGGRWQQGSENAPHQRAHMGGTGKAPGEVSPSRAPCPGGLSGLSWVLCPHTHPILDGWGALWSPVNMGVHRARLPACWVSEHLTGKNLGPALGLVRLQTIQPRPGSMRGTGSSLVTKSHVAARASALGAFRPGTSLSLG